MANVTITRSLTSHAVVRGVAWRVEPAVPGSLEDASSVQASAGDWTAVVEYEEIRLDASAGSEFVDDRIRARE